MTSDTTSSWRWALWRWHSFFAQGICIMNWIDSKLNTPLHPLKQTLKLPALGPLKPALMPKRRMVGLLLLIIGALSLLLTGCASSPQYVPVQCPPYPALPENLRNHTSKNLDLVPPSMLPSVRPD